MSTRTRTRTRVGALIAAVAVAGGVVFGAGPAMAAPPDSLVSKVGKGFAAVVEDNIDSLCMGKEDTGREDDSEETTTPAPSTSTAPDVPSAGCDINDAELQKAAEKCLPSGGKEKATAEEVSADKDEFLKCMAEEGFGETEKEEEADTETKDAVQDLSLARVGEALSAFYVNSLSPDGDNGDRGDDEETPATGSEGPTASGDADATGLPAWSSLLSTGATAGAFIAAPNKEKGESSSWIFGAGDARNDATLDLRALDRSKAPQAVDQGVEQYALYGATLNALGLDSAAAKDEGSSGFRYMSGTALMAAYTAAGAVDAVFDATLGVLQKLNPFSWMADALRDAGTPESFTEGMKGDASYSDDSGTFDEIKAFLGRFFLLLLDFSWGVTIPLLIGFTIIALLLSRKKSPGSRLKTLGIRVAFVAIGLPLIGGLYTGVLGGLAGGADDAASSNATKVVLSTVVDFQAWADQRLGLPEDAPDLVWDRAIDGPTARTVADGRRAALAINAQIRPEWKKFGPKSGDENVEWNESMMDGELAAPNPQESRNPFGSTLDLLKRYTSGEQISAGAYETGVKRGLTEAAANGRGSVVLKWVTDLTDPAKLSKMTAEDVERLNNPLIQVAEGGLSGETGEHALDMRFRFGTDAYCPSWKVVAKDWNGKDSPVTQCNMSPMSMFNYLNTSWDGSTGVKLFSPRDSSSAYARDQHMSANLHGGGAMTFVYWFSAMTLLVSFALIGFLYAFGLMTAMVRRVVTILGAAPFALMGFTGGIAKVLVAATSALVEIVGTLVIYRLMVTLMMIVPTLLERPLSARASDVDGDEAVGLAGAGMGLAIEAFDNPKTAVMVIALVASIGVIIFTMVAVKVRSHLIAGFDAAMSRVLNKFLETDVSSGGDAQPGALRQGLTRGAGMAATSAIMRGGGGGGDDTGGGAPGGEGGEGGVEQGTGEGVPGAGDGSMSVDANGGLLDRAGNPVKNADGSAATAAGFLGGDGPLTDGSGGEIIGASGSPLTADDVTGFGPGGELLGADGAPITDGNGNPLTNANAAKAAGDLAGQKAMADRVMANGLSNQEGSAGVPVGALGNFGGVSPTAAPVETSAAPRPGNLRADGDGDSGVVRQAASMAAVQAAQQRLSGAGRGQGTLARTVRESMSGKSAGGQSGGGGTGMTGLPRAQRPAGSGLGTTAITAATAGMMPKRGGGSGD